MFDSLNKYGLTKKYAIIGFVGGSIGTILSYALDLMQSQSAILMTPIATAVGGYLGGFLGEKFGKSS
jgi:hypothetical protein